VLAEGVADEISTNLARVARIRVSSPASVRYALTTGARDPRRIGTVLGSRWLVDGQMLAAGGVVRVNAQLIEAANGRMRWSGSMVLRGFGRDRDRRRAGARRARAAGAAADGECLGL
jgi:TolB-like protein